MHWVSCLHQRPWMVHGFLQPTSHHPGLTDTRMALWLGSEVAAWDNANLLTLLVFYKKLLVSGKDVLIRRWQRVPWRPLKELDKSSMLLLLPLALQPGFPGSRSVLCPDLRVRWAPPGNRCLRLKSHWPYEKGRQFLFLSLSKWEPLGLWLLEQLPSCLIFCLDIIAVCELYTLVLPFSICAWIGNSKEQSPFLTGSQKGPFSVVRGEPSCFLGVRRGLEGSPKPHQTLLELPENHTDVCQVKGGGGQEQTFPYLLFSISLKGWQVPDTDTSYWFPKPKYVCSSVS